MIYVRVILSVLICSLSIEAWASPESWFTATFSLHGGVTGGRFGAEIACSKAVVSTLGRSYIAVGSPNASNGAGRVYIYDADAASVAAQELTPLSATSNQHFGRAIQFMDDLNGDGVDELAIGAPGEASLGGSVYIFSSSVAGGAVTWSNCGSVSGGVGYGEELQALRDQVAGGFANLIVGIPAASQIAGYHFAYSLGGVCTGVIDETYGQNLGGSSQFGYSMAQIPYDSPSSDGKPHLLVGQPFYGTNVGRVNHVTSASSYYVSVEGSTGDKLGAVVAGDPYSTFHAYSLIGAGSDRGSVSIRHNSLSGAPSCVASKPLAEPSDGFGLS